MQIHHDSHRQRFETTIDGITAFLSYHAINETTLNYAHTIVPNELGGRGVGSALVKFALDYANDHHYKIVPSCWFVDKFINKHSQYQHLLA